MVTNWKTLFPVPDERMLLASIQLISELLPWFAFHQTHKLQTFAGARGEATFSLDYVGTCNAAGVLVKERAGRFIHGNGNRISIYGIYVDAPCGTRYCNIAKSRRWWRDFNSIIKLWMPIPVEPGTGPGLTRQFNVRRLTRVGIFFGNKREPCRDRSPSTVRPVHSQSAVLTVRTNGKRKWIFDWVHNKIWNAFYSSKTDNKQKGKKRKHKTHTHRHVNCFKLRTPSGV